MRRAQQGGVQKPDEVALFQQILRGLRKFQIEHVIENPHGVLQVADMVGVAQRIGWRF